MLTIPGEGPMVGAFSVIMKLCEGTFEALVHMSTGSPYVSRI